MANTDSAAPAPTAPVRTQRTVSEALLNEKWDQCLSNLAIKSTLGFSFGVIFSVLLFRRRAWPALVRLGFGGGRAYQECDANFRQSAASSRDGLRVLRP